MALHSKFFVLFFFLSLCLMASPSFSADAVRKAMEKANDQAIVIKSDSLEIDNQKRVVTFTGSVDAKRDDLVITCQKMLLYYTGAVTKEASQKGSLKMDMIVAKGGVKISRPDGGLATAEEAIYYVNDEKVILSGKPAVKQGEDFVEGSRIILFLKEDRSIVEGSDGKQVRAVISSGLEKR